MSKDEPVILIETRAHRMYITLNRPEALNAQNDAMRLALIDAYDRFDGDDDLAVLILRGAGRAFSAGADLKEHVPGPSGEPFQPKGNQHFDRLERLRKPTIACIHGHAVGGGLEIALCADIRIATEDAQLGTPEPRTNGGMPGIAVYRLSRMIPHGEAMRIMLTSRSISGTRAFDIGLVQDLAPDIDAAMQLADQLADQIIECNPGSIATIKQIASWKLVNDIAESRRFAEQARRDEGRGDRSGADYLARRRTGEA